MTWTTTLTALLMLTVFAVTSGVILFFLACLAWRWFWQWLREEMLADWEMLDKPVKDDESCSCDCKCNRGKP
jgi:hypothetical protein